jgi:hypothetical protein
MGISVGVPKPVQLQITQIFQKSSETVIVDSNAYNGNFKWLTKVCQAIENNKKVKKIVFKLYIAEFSDITDSKANKFLNAFKKSIQNRESIVIYGSGLLFLEDREWIDLWSFLNVEVTIT